MRGTTFNDRSLQYVTLKIWFKTGSFLQEAFSLNKTTFADVKHLAVKQFLMNNNSNDNLPNYRRSSFNTIATSKNNLSSDELDNYTLISIGSKRMIDEDKTLRQQTVKDGEEYLLATKNFLSSPKSKQTSSSCTVDAALIEKRTEHLSNSSNLLDRNYRASTQREFRTDLNRILMTLIEASQKLLWHHPDAESIFKQVEEFLLQSSSDESNNPTTISTTDEDVEKLCAQVNKLADMGFTEQQARIALKRARYDLHAAMDLLLTGTNITDDNETNDKDESDDNNKPEPARPALFSRNSSFISVRKFRQQCFQPNPKAIEALKEIGFALDDIIMALRIFNNDKNLACEYLLGDKQQRQDMHNAETEQGLDPNSSIFQLIMQNPIIQRTLNSPKTFFIMLQIAENPASIANYISDPDIGNMLLQISRIYHAEKENMNTSANNSNDSNQQEEYSSRTTERLGGDFDGDSD